MMINSWSFEERQVLVINTWGHQHVNGILAARANALASRASADPQNEMHEHWVWEHTNILRWQGGGGGDSSKEYSGDSTEVGRKAEGWRPGTLAKKAFQAYQVPLYGNFSRATSVTAWLDCGQERIRGKHAENPSTLATVSRQFSKAWLRIVFHVVPQFFAA